MKLYVCHRGNFYEYTQNSIIVWKDFPKFCFLTGAMIDLPMSQTNFYGLKDVRAIDVRQYWESIYAILAVAKANNH